MKTFDEIRDLLAEKFKKEKLRLKSYDTRASSFDLANAVARHVQALMTDSRRRELLRFKDKFEKIDKNALSSRSIVYNTQKYFQERLKATKAMAQALQNVADANEKARPWKRKPEKKKHHTHRHGNPHKHRSGRHG